MNQQEIKNEYRKVLKELDISPIDAIHCFATAYTLLAIEIESKQSFKNFMNSFPELMQTSFTVSNCLSSIISKKVLECLENSENLKDD